MKLTDLRTSQYLEILSFLNPHDLLQLSISCKFFILFFTKHQNLIQKQFLSLIGLPNLPCFLDWKILLKNLKNSSSTALRNQFLPYYTDGGVYENLSSYFIGALTSDEETHCTKKSQNVLIKYIYAPQAEFNFGENPVNYQVDEFVYFIDYIENDKKNHRIECPAIEKIKFITPISGFTCPAEVMMCFCSFSEIKDFSLIENFYSCENLAAAQNIAGNLGIKCEISLNHDHELILFENKSNDLQPICWVKADIKKCSLQGFWVHLKKKFFARYFYLLLVSRFIKVSYDGIDITKVTPYMKVLDVVKT
ncbi:hypothetical protein SteCoe_12369 [Stentor coeruleus]|uniref:F-box domain-containing protein n=1 Tax=Stentor coeruleus TaxID=5963 RepID=A0A1R2CAZ1_9CILI|nr:hypothetical protein SteCoe_12369 [Stentor coeruleus]